jgi:hypothetical protein
MAACIDRKTTLAGKTLFTCELLHLEQGFGVLNYIVCLTFPSL